MARIRTIKPEFPQSESMGRVSRDARLLFVQLWTICDDAGRTRGASRMLASLLFPYDDDAPSLIDMWLTELEQEGCLVRYEADGSTYIQVQKWQQHQKIDKPSASKFPAPRESSRVLDEPSRKIVQDQGPRTKDQGRDQGVDARKQVRAPIEPDSEFASKAKSQKPEVVRGTRWHPDNVVPDEWRDAASDARERAGLGAVDMRHEVVKFSHYWASPDAKNPMKKDWRQTFINWILNSKGSANGHGKPEQKSTLTEVFGGIYAEARAAREAGRN